MCVCMLSEHQDGCGKLGSWEKAPWMETALTNWGSLEVPFPAQLAIKQLQRTSRLTSWGPSPTLLLQD